MDFCRTERMAVLGSEFIDDELVQHSLDVLEIGHVASSSDDGGVSNRMETLNVFETG